MEQFELILCQASKINFFVFFIIIIITILIMIMIEQDSVEDDDEYGTIPEEENQENLERNR